MGTHAGATTGSRDVVRAGASEGIGESGVVEPSVAEHSVRGPNTDGGSMANVTENISTGSMVGVIGNANTVGMVCDMGNVIADVAMGGGWSCRRSEK